MVCVLSSDENRERSSSAPFVGKLGAVEVFQVDKKWLLLFEEINNTPQAQARAPWSPLADMWLWTRTPSLPATRFLRGWTSTHPLGRVGRDQARLDDGYSGKDEVVTSSPEQLAAKVAQLG